jgi:serine protease AprX
MLPGTKTAIEAMHLFQNRNGDSEIEKRIAAQKLLSPHYQHVDGTSFAAALVAGTIACMLEANPTLSPVRAKQILKETALPLPDVPTAKQGAGALQPALAVASAASPQLG